MGLIALSIPAFLLLIGVELLWARRQRADVYRFDDSIADLGCGILSQLFVGVVAVVSLAAYQYVSTRFAMFRFPNDAVWAWAAAFLGVDFCYYWFHRASHQVHFMWAAHVVHHQSEEYNLAVALRQSVFQPAFSWLFYMPLALLGVPLSMFLVLSAVNTLYQFWIHTRLIGRLGFLERVFNTPSHHRVHHGRNPKYLDRNHGGTFIIWDQLFGTFQVEEEEPEYGVTVPLRSHDPVWANFHTWVYTWRRARSFSRWQDRLSVWFRRPEWSPPDVGVTEKAPAPPAPVLSRATVLYVLLQFSAVVAATVLFLWNRKTFAKAELVVLGLLIAISAWAIAALVETKSWSRSFEWVRVPVFVGALAWFTTRLL